MLHFTQGDTTSALALNAEALTINRTLWQHHPTAHGDRFARTLAVKVSFLKQKGEERVTACELLHELHTVAYSDSLKLWAQGHMKTSCGQEKLP